MNFLREKMPIVCVEVNYALRTRGKEESDILKIMNEIGYGAPKVRDGENFIFQT